MIKPFQMSPAMQIGTDILRFLLRLGIPISSLKLLIHHGRKSGKQYITPVALVEADGERWLVAAFGEVNWVKNIRAVGQAKFTHGSHTEIVDIVELSPTEAAPILKRFLKNFGFVPFIPPYFEANANAPLADFEQEAIQHPVFRLVAPKA